MPIIRVDALSDPRVDTYRNLKDRELAKAGGLFIAEGEHLLRRLLASDYPAESVLLAERRVEEIGPLVPEGVPIYVLPQEGMNEIIGYKFHSGVIASGRRKARLTLEQLLAHDRAVLTLVVCPEIANAENMGALVRIACGFGADAMILGEKCCDPFWRQAVRVSMGAIFQLPLLQSDDLLRDLGRLHEEWGVEFAATVLDKSAEHLTAARRPAKFGLMLGNEAQGLDSEWLGACQRRITIPMQRGTDSLNVSVAAGIFLYHFTREDVREDVRTIAGG